VTPPTVLSVADLTLDLVGRRVRRGGKVINLTPTEFAILTVLMRHAGRVVRRTRLAESVWQGETFFNVIDVHVGHLRKKLDSAGAVPLIRTVRRAGYIIRNPLGRQPRPEGMTSSRPAVSSSACQASVGVVEIPLVGRYGQGKVARVDERFADAVRAHKWYLSNGSTYTKIAGETVYLSRYILALADVPIPSRIDHLNQDKLDCRLENLKLARPSIEHRGPIRTPHPLGDDTGSPRPAAP
jgi:DNA-binding winged helix-turn-helix (wHTH) protein